jgi:hypothetical protein
MAEAGPMKKIKEKGKKGTSSSITSMKTKEKCKRNTRSWRFLKPDAEASLST